MVVSPLIENIFSPKRGEIIELQINPQNSYFVNFTSYPIYDSYDSDEGLNFPEDALVYDSCNLREVFGAIIEKNLLT